MGYLVPEDVYKLVVGWIAFAVVIVIIFYGIGLVLAIWIYTDAKKRDKDSALTWFLLVLLTSCIGCIIYLLVRD